MRAILLLFVLIVFGVYAVAPLGEICSKMTLPCPSCTYANEMRYILPVCVKYALILKICELKCDMSTWFAAR